MSPNRLQPSLFWYLCALGVAGLWGCAFFDGMFDRLDLIMSTRRMLDGQVLRDSYTGNAFIDERLTLLSAFYQVLTDTTSSGPRLLFFDINAVVSCTNLWVLIEGSRRGVSRWMLQFPAWIIVLWNANGAAIFQPPFFYWLVKHQTRRRNPTITPTDAIAICALTIPMMLSPLLLFVPPWLGVSTHDHHGYIAVFHASPLILAAAFEVLRRLMGGFFDGKNARAAGKQSHGLAKACLVISLTTAGTIAASAHVFTLIAGLNTSDPGASLHRMFVPSFALNTAGAVESESAALMENFHLFSQFDWYVVSAGCVLFVYLTLLDVEKSGKKMDEVSEKADGDVCGPAEGVIVNGSFLAKLVGGSILIGPGAAGCFAFALQEGS